MKSCWCCTGVVMIKTAFPISVAARASLSVKTMLIRGFNASGKHLHGWSLEFDLFSCNQSSFAFIACVFKPTLFREITCTCTVSHLACIHIDEWNTREKAKSSIKAAIHFINVPGQPGRMNPPYPHPQYSQWEWDSAWPVTSDWRRCWSCKLLGLLFQPHGQPDQRVTKCHLD